MLRKLEVITWTRTPWRSSSVSEFSRTTSGARLDVSLTEHDLDEIVANHTRLRERIKAPLKLGHDAKKVLAGQRDGQPALGWVESLRREGRKLLATIREVPEVIARAIDRKLYRRVSAEFQLAFEQSPWERNLKTGVTGDLWKRAKVRALDDQRDLRDVFIDALRAYLAQSKPRRTT